jgi:hypothetical protein
MKRKIALFCFSKIKEDRRPGNHITQERGKVTPGPSYGQPTGGIIARGGE